MHFFAIKIILMNTIFQTWVIERSGSLLSLQFEDYLCPLIHPDFRGLLEFFKNSTSIIKFKPQKSVILKYRADNVFIILFQGIHVVIPGDIYAQDSESCIHKPDHC